jgi:hypothetical protein
VSDELFREVDEEVRQDRYQDLVKRYGTYVVGAVVLIVGATIAFVVWRDSQESARMADSERFLTAVVEEQTSSEAALDQLREIAKDGTAGYRYLASLREASLLAEAGKTADAVAVFDALAADEAYSTTYRDMAKIFAVANGMDLMSRDEVRNRMEPLNTPENPFRFTAREFLAVAAIGVGDANGAREMLRSIVEDQGTPLATRARASEFLALIGN